MIKSVTESDEAESMVRQDMEEGEKIIDNGLLSRVIEEGTVAPKFQKYSEAMALADGEIGKIFEDDKNVDSTLKIFQRSISKYLKK